MSKHSANGSTNRWRRLRAAKLQRDPEREWYWRGQQCRQPGHELFTSSRPLGASICGVCYTSFQTISGKNPTW
jgi:hypothetical protein